jgi:hypothetical protein
MNSLGDLDVWERTMMSIGYAAIILDEDLRKFMQRIALPVAYSRTYGRRTKIALMNNFCS